MGIHMLTNSTSANAADSTPSLLERAKALVKSQNNAAGHQILQQILKENPETIQTLLWLARATSDEREAQAAANLAYSLAPDNEIAKRALAALAEKFPTSNGKAFHEISQFTGMTIAQARAVSWPFKGYNRPVGLLCDEQKIDGRDLAWAAENAFDPNVKNAARTVLLTNLLQEELHEPAPPAKVIEGPSHSARQERFSFLYSGIIFGVLVTFFLSFFAFSVLFSKPLQQTYPHIVLTLNLISIFGILPLFFLGRYILNYTFDRGENHRKGREAEQKVLDLMRVSLQTPWVIFHNLSWPRRKMGDIDLALLGPGGVWVLEIKAFTHPTRVRGDQWQYKSRRGWRTMQKHPGKQARRNAVALKTYLEQKGFQPGWVQAIVIWAGQEDLLETYDPQTPVWKLTEISERTLEFWAKVKWSEEQITGAVNVLETMMKAEKTK